MSVPEWAKSEESVDRAKEYLRSGTTVDFFELITREILIHHPSNLPQFALQIVNEMLAGHEVQTGQLRSTKSVEDTMYMETTKVSDFLDAWILALLQAKPESDLARLQFHKNYLQSLTQAKS